MDRLSIAIDSLAFLAIGSALHREHEDVGALLQIIVTQNAATQKVVGMDPNQQIGQVCFGIVFVLIGVFQVLATRWRWYVNHWKYRNLESLLGETGAKLLTIVFGVAVVVFGLLVAIGIIALSD
jgi:hypothetical protein